MKNFTSTSMTHWAGLTLMLAACAASAATCESSSGSKRVTTIELYTSEGCNSCPPADRWFSQIMRKQFGPQELVPLALHVDYWDELGWKDRFAQHKFSVRQHLLARRNRAQTVYTPQFLFNGKDLRLAGADLALSKRLSAINALPPGALIQLRQSVAADRIEIDLEIDVFSNGESPEAEAYVALSENNLYSEIRAGENAGRRLAHDFVVRELLGPIPIGLTGKARWSGKIGLAPAWKREDLALTVFVQDVRHNDILQAMRIPACNSP
jgi:hypothetical protein